MHSLLTLPNGVRLLTEEVPAVQTAAIGFFFTVGSRHEAPQDNGSAHFIEHMLFKGTSTRSARQLAMDMDAIGGQFNAYTTKELTCFYTHCLTEHLDRAVDILTDMIFCSTFTQENLEMERGVILEEIGMYEDSPEDVVSEQLIHQIYRGSPLALPILGTEASLAGITAPSLHAWQQAHYIPSALVVSLAGRFTAHHLDRLTALLGSMPPAPMFSTLPAAYQPALTVRSKEIEQNHLLLGFPAPSYRDPRRVPCSLLNSIVGGTSSSRLFQELRERLGLCYAVYSLVADHEDTGLFGVYAAVSPEVEQATLDALRAVVLDLAEHGPTQKELDRARDQARASMVMGLESTPAKMNHLANSMLFYNRVRSIESFLEEYESVTREQVRDMAQEIFRMDQASLSVVGRAAEAGAYQAWLDRPAPPQETSPSG